MVLLKNSNNYLDTSTIEFIFSKNGGCWPALLRKNDFNFYLGFPSCTFAIHRTAEEGRGYVFNSSLPLPLVSQTRRH